jgi:hypothetical protein
MLVESCPFWQGVRCGGVMCPAGSSRACRSEATVGLLQICSRAAGGPSSWQVWPAVCAEHRAAAPRQAAASGLFNVVHGIVGEHNN